MGNILAYNLDKTTLLYRCHEVEHMILVKRWENHINIYATVVGKAGICMSDPYESSEDDIPNSMYDLILHLYQFDVKLTSLCFGMCLFVLNRTIVIFYTNLTLWIVHLRWPHRCVYPLATYVCLSTHHICVFAHSPHMGVYPLATYVCLSARHICVHVPSQDLEL
jgi:hypothetical protein